MTSDASSLYSASDPPPIDGSRASVDDDWFPVLLVAGLVVLLVTAGLLATAF